MSQEKALNLTQTNDTLLGEIFRTLADVADGKLSLDDAIKQTTTNNKEIKQLKKHYHAFNQFVSSLKNNIKKEIRNTQLTNDFIHSYDTQSAIVIRDKQGNIKGFIGGKPKTKQSFWNKIKHRFSRSLRQHADFIDGKMSVKEFTQTPLKNLHQDYMDDSKLYRQGTSIVQGINKGIKQSIAELRGTLRPQGNTQNTNTDSITNLYTSLDNTQLTVALGTAYENIVRLQHDGYNSDKDKKEILFDFQQLISAARQRYPNTPTAPQGSYFKDKDIAAIEAQLFPFLKEAGKNNSVIMHDTKRYEKWRNNQSFSEGNLTEHTFHNSARYSRQDSSGFHTMNTLKSPLKAGQNAMSETQLQQAKTQVARLNIR